MENIKKFMVVVGIITIASLLLAFVTNPPANEENEKILTVKVVEAREGIMISPDSFIVIVDENGKQEIVELEKLSKKSTISNNNTITINNTLNSIANRGYRLTSSSVGGDVYAMYSTYVFVKK